MPPRFRKVFQFKITLQDVRPPVWRTIQVPASYSFWDLHVAIQDAMGWTDSHLHDFQILNPTHDCKDHIGIPDDELFEGDEPFLAGWEVRISDYFSRDNPTALYVYDFGDDWQHVVQLEEILPRVQGVRYPLCLAGQRRCPPEDVGGVPGYEDFLDAIRDPRHVRIPLIPAAQSMGFRPLSPRHCGHPVHSIPATHRSEATQGFHS